ncbi:MAG TPA: mannanase [Verrucomicrobiae bacterium]|jgi:mannan endo-1,4-beta-mannosidase|nr:mannanase [Verrucomicrobiae bacterium]
MKPFPTSRRTFIKTGALALPIIAAGGGRLMAGSGSKSDFVRVRNGRFELRNKPYFYVGANMWFGGYVGDATLASGRERLVRELDELQKLGATNVRILAGSETSPLVGAIANGITRSPHDWDENLLTGLDFCLAEMRKRDMRAILFLSNYWQWSGSFAQYVRWITGEDIPDPDKPVMAKGDWHAFMKFSARFYSTPAAVELYREYVTKMVRRKNTVNGVIYRDDPTIMTWELANEPRPCADDSTMAKDVPIYCDWVDKTARMIHDLDGNHLVCTGSEGIWGCLQKPEVFIQAHKTPAIDYVTVHMWLKNWGWLKTPTLGAEFEIAAGKAHDHVEMHTKIATDNLKKPLVLEEFGLPRDFEKYAPDSPTTARDEYYRRMFAQVADSCRAGRSLQAANFWAWGGEGRVTTDKSTSAGMYMGDPPCEPQGLNSVFDKDTTTHAIIATANQNLAAIAG